MSDSRFPSTSSVIEKARGQAARWRLNGLGEGLDEDPRPPASSALLWGYLWPHAVRPLPRPQPATGFRLVVRRVGRRLRRALTPVDIAEVAVRLDRLEEYTGLLGEELCRTLNRLDVELAEARVRLGELEDDGPEGMRRPAAGGPGAGAVS